MILAARAAQRYREDGDAIAFHALPHLTTRDVADVLERACKRIAKELRRRRLFDDLRPRAGLGAVGQADRDVDPHRHDDARGAARDAQRATSRRGFAFRS